MRDLLHTTVVGNLMYSLFAFFYLGKGKGIAWGRGFSGGT